MLCNLTLLCVSKLIITILIFFGMGTHAYLYNLKEEFVYINIGLKLSAVQKVCRLAEV